MIRANFKRDALKPWAPRKLFKLSKLLSNAARFDLVVHDGPTQYRFTPTGSGEMSRYLTFFTKEEGTIEWVKNTIREGDVFFDIGANVGLYSLYAARQAQNVKVYAFEPHKNTFVCLIDNVRNNGLLSSIFPISIPLGERNDVFKLHYKSLGRGSSMNQLGHTHLPGQGQGDFQPEFEEIVYAVALDDLVARGMVPMPTVIKIDVDGNEPKILEGMKKILTAPGRPRSLQVEINPGQKAEIVAFFETHGYRHDYSHYTATKKHRFEQGVSENDLAHNAVFVPA